MNRKNTSDSKLILILIPVAITILKMLVYIPVNVTGGLTDVNYSEHTHIVKIVSNNVHLSKCEDCVNYSLIAGKYWIENLIVFGVVFALVFIYYIFVSKPTRKKKAAEDVEVGNNNVMGLNIMRNNEQENVENQMVNVSNDDSDDLSAPTTIGDDNVEQSVQSVVPEPVMPVENVQAPIDEVQTEIPVSEIPEAEVQSMVEMPMEPAQSVAEMPIEETQSMVEMPIPEVSAEQPVEEIQPVQEVQPIEEAQPVEQPAQEIEELNFDVPAEEPQPTEQAPAQEHYPMPNEYTFENVDNKEE